MGLFQELKRRNVIRMAGLYLVGAWLIAQVAETVLPAFEVPNWVMRAIVIVLVLGFLPAVAIAWIFELTPQGLKRDEDVPAGQSIAPQTARRMDRMLLVVTLLALGYFTFDKFVLAPRRDAALVTQTAAHVTAEISAEKPKLNPRSIAVLPFVNMSTDPENEFFSDGLSEEILNSLARIDGMQVVGRTSSFQFKGKNEDLRTIGGKLDVATVLEGSVRREGERARITAQLIRTSDGIHLWSETYDRTLQDTLAVQVDIAEQVAAALDVVLDDKQRAEMRAAGVKNVDAFIAYQKGLKLYNDAHAKPELDFFDTMALATTQFAKATALEPDFALAYYAAADRYEHILQADHRSRAELLDAQRQALKTLDLAAANSNDEQQRLLTVAERQMLSDDWRGLSSRIDAAFKQSGCNASNWLPVFASAFGYGDEIESFGARASACDPLNSINFHTRLTAALATGNAQRALALMAIIEKAGGGAPPNLPSRALALAMLGRVDEAGKLLDSMNPDHQNEGYVMALAIVGRARGEDLATIHARVRAVDRTQSKFQQWGLADMVEVANADNRAEANRLAAALDARPGGGFLLALFSESCYCGAPFDIDATPNFKARLAESGLRWPPPAIIQSPSPASKAIKSGNSNRQK